MPSLAAPCATPLPPETRTPVARLTPCPWVLQTRPSSMGRHRSTLRDLGWGVSNSPNPWKQGSAKRVVRTLDYSQAELDEVTVEPVAEPSAAAAPEGAPLDDRLQQLHQDGAPPGAPARAAQPS
jgi:hypothetical protein